MEQLATEEMERGRNGKHISREKGEHMEGGESEKNKGEEKDQGKSGESTKRLVKDRQRTDKTEEVGRCESREDYRKDLTVEVEVEGMEEVSMMDLLKAVKKECGEVIGCRVRSERIFEITLKSETVKMKVMDGIRVKGALVHARDIINNEMVVSFINLPVYLEDKNIFAKLEEWGVKPVSAIKRRVWPGTQIVDGTRFLKVMFTKEVQSLPYSTKFVTLRGTEYFRVIHDRQVRVCRLCIKPGHIFRECPEFKCFKCGRTGHYARECEEWRVTVGEDGVEDGQEIGGEGGHGEQMEEQAEESVDSMEEEDGDVEKDDDGGRDEAESMEKVRGDEEDEMEESGGKAESGGRKEKRDGAKESRQRNDGLREEEERDVRAEKANTITQRLKAKRKAEKDKEWGERKAPWSGM